MSTTAVDTLSTAEDIGLQSQEVPTDLATIRGFAFDSENPKKPPKGIIASLTVKLINKKPLTVKERQMVFNILRSFYSIDPITSDIESNFQIRWIMSTIMGESPLAKGPYEYPDPFPQDAAIVLAKVENDLSYEESIGDEADEPISSTTAGPKRKRGSPRRSVPRDLPDYNDPALQGIMHNIVNVCGRRRKILDKSLARPCDVVGSNGLEVGQWWPFRICALRDGAHGHTMGGIAGGKDTGAFSIVVAGQYSDLDKDKGNTLYYSGSNSHANKDAENPHVTSATKALQRALAIRRSVRVLRAAGGDPRWCPSKGLRYDGLYTVMEEAVRENHVGGMYLRYRLVRDPGQPEIDMSRPTQQEGKMFDRLKTSI